MHREPATTGGSRRADRATPGATVRPRPVHARETSPRIPAPAADPSPALL
ncbi:MAG: hypothetical protein ACLFTU_08105 [Puniceicoccaceae bacterium]